MTYYDKMKKSKNCFWNYSNNKKNTENKPINNTRKANQNMKKKKLNKDAKLKLDQIDSVGKLIKKEL